MQKQLVEIASNLEIICDLLWSDEDDLVVDDADNTPVCMLSGGPQLLRPRRKIRPRMVPVESPAAAQTENISQGLSVPLPGWRSSNLIHPGCKTSYWNFVADRSLSSLAFCAAPLIPCLAVELRPGTENGQ
jgi:hypothetical protein